MCLTPKAPKPAKAIPSVIDASAQVREERQTRRRRRGYLTTFSGGMGGDMSAPNVAVKALTGV